MRNRTLDLMGENHDLTTQATTHRFFFSPLQVISEGRKTNKQYVYQKKVQISHLQLYVYDTKNRKYT